MNHGLSLFGNCELFGSSFRNCLCFFVDRWIGK